MRRERVWFDIVKVGVDMPRGELYDRINRRVDRMLADGLEAEARAVYPYRSLNALQTVGYREFFDYFDGRISYDEAVELIKRNSRRYAKRQLTWFRRDGEIRWFRPDETRRDYKLHRFWQIVKISYFCRRLSPKDSGSDGGIGRHAGLKHPVTSNGRAGSTPGSGYK